MKKHINNFYLAVLAGIMISIGCIVFLSIENKIIGSLLFTTGLLTVLVFKLNLFTGKAPYICKNDLNYSIFIVVVWFGNFIGVAITAFLIRNTAIFAKIIEKCTALAEAKVTTSISSLFILSIFCGILMYIAVDVYNTHNTDKNFFTTILVIFCVSVFILSGFEHSIADMFYFVLALPIKQWIFPLIIVTSGNIIGGNIFCAVCQLAKETQ